MKTHQFERLETLLSDILEEMKRMNVISVPSVWHYQESTDGVIDLSDFFKNISESTSAKSSAPNSDSKAG